MITASRSSTLALIGGRLALASLFLLGGLNKLLNYAATLESMEAVGLSPASLLLPIVIGLELIGGVLVAVGRRGAAPAALALAVFTLSTNLFFHDFWNMGGEIAALELSLFFKNICIAGGLVFYAAVIGRFQSAAEAGKPSNDR